jgi:galactokinase
MTDLFLMPDMQTVAGRISSDPSLPLKPDEPMVVARAPAGLDVMGGLADRSGSLLLQATLDRAVVIACQGRRDQQVLLRALDQTDGQGQYRWPLAALYAGRDTLTAPEQFVGNLNGRYPHWAKSVTAVFYALLESGTVPHLGGGATILFDSSVPTDAGLGASAATQVGTIQVLCQLYDVQLDAMGKARVCQRAEQIASGRTGGIRDQLTSLRGEPDGLLQLRCRPPQLLGTLPLPAGLRIVGVDSQVRADDNGKVAETHAAACIGHRIITEHAASGEDGRDSGGRYLADVTPEEFVRQYRDMLPKKMTGNEFLQRYGNDVPGEVDIVPERTYKVRSRTEHCIYENRRVQQFAACIARARRTGREEPLVEAGQLMYSSHWSYGQRCGLAAVETDWLVKRIRGGGEQAGLFGAKVTGTGVGGTVAVLMRDSSQTRDELQRALEDYQARTGLAATVFEAACSFGAELGAGQHFSR